MRHWILLLLAALSVAVQAQVVVRGVVTDGKAPVEFATVDIRQGEQWAMTDQEGRFAVRVARMGKALVRVTCIGYEPLHTTIDIRQGIDSLRLTLQPTNLQLQQVVVTAQRRTENATTSYVIDRQALDNQQIVNVSDIMTLLPGGKTVNSSLMTDSRIALHAQGGEKGNAAFGTAVEVDGQRLQNNAEMGETTGVSTRTVSSTNVASIEVVPGIPSVEYGDLSNGIVKVNTKRGHTPWEVSLGTNPYTKQVAVSKGFDMRHGVLNASLEHSRSYSNLASPHTAYQRNTLSLNYRTTTRLAGQPLMVNLNLGGNVGGYNSKADPDQFVDTVADCNSTGIWTIHGWLHCRCTPTSRWPTSCAPARSTTIAAVHRRRFTPETRATTLPPTMTRTPMRPLSWAPRATGMSRVTATTSHRASCSNSKRVGTSKAARSTTA